MLQHRMGALCRTTLPHLRISAPAQHIPLFIRQEVPGMQDAMIHLLSFNSRYFVSDSHWRPLEHRARLCSSLYSRRAAGTGKW